MFEFPTINAQFGLNGDGLLRVRFPKPSTYTIRITINVEDLGEKTQDLKLILH